MKDLELPKEAFTQLGVAGARWEGRSCQVMV